MHVFTFRFSGERQHHLPSNRFRKVDDFDEILPYIEGLSDEDVVIVITPFKRHSERSCVMTRKISHETEC